MATKEKSGQTTGAAQKKASSRRSGTAASKVEPAKGKLGVMVVGMGAVATTMIAGVEAVRRGLAQAHRLAHANGNHPPGEANRQQFAADQGLCSAGGFERPGLHRVGHL